MFCNEHGTVDYCPECVRDDLEGELESKDARIASLEARVKKLEGHLAESIGYVEDALWCCHTQNILKEGENDKP